VTHDEVKKLAELYLRYPTDEQKVKDGQAQFQEELGRQNHQRVQSFIKHFIPTEIQDTKELSEKVQTLVNSCLKSGNSIDFSLNQSDPMKHEVVMTLWQDTPNGYVARSCKMSVNPNSATQPNALAFQLALDELSKIGVVDSPKLDAALATAKENHKAALSTEVVPTKTTTMRKSK